MKPRTYVTFALVAALSLAGCAALFGKPQAPRLSIADVRLVNASLFEQKYKLGLRIQNPNSFELPIEGVDYEVRLNDRFFGSGVSNKPVTVPAYGTEILEVDAFSNIATVLKMLRSERGIPEKLRYRLKGHVRLKTGGLKLPFDHSGDVSLTPKGKDGGPKQEPQKPQPDPQQQKT